MVLSGINVNKTPLCAALAILLYTGCGQLETKWQRKFNALGPGNYRINSISSSKENIFLTGTYDERNSKPTCFLACYDKSGALLWHQVYETPGSAKASGKEILVIRTQEELLAARVDIYLLAEIQDTAGINSAVLAKCDTTGNLVWEKTVTASSGFMMCDLLDDFEGNLYVAGWEKDSEGKRTISVAKIRESGEIEWSTKYYSVDLDFDDLSFDITEPSTFVVTGLLKNTNELFYIKYNGSGQFRRMIRYKPKGEVQAMSGIRITPSGTIFAIANVSNSGTGIDFLTAAFDAKDSLLWAHEYDGQTHGDDYCRTLSFDEEMNIYVTGVTENPVGITNLVTVKYDISGNQLWTQTLGNNKAVQAMMMEPEFLRFERKRPYLSYLYIAGTAGDDAMFTRCNTNGVFSFHAQYGEPGSVTVPTALADECLALQRTRDTQSEALVVRIGPSAILGIARWD